MKHCIFGLTLLLAMPCLAWAAPQRGAQADSAAATPQAPANRAEYRALMLKTLDADARTDTIRANDLHRQILAKTAGALIWAESPMRKVYLHDRVVDAPANPLLVLEAARNEYESFQIVITPSSPLSGVTCELTDLRQPSGAVIPARQFVWNAIGYTFCEFQSEVGMGPYTTESWGPRIGYVPDPLLPLDPVDLKHRRNYPLWCAIRIPKQAAAGEYSGTLRIRTGQRILAEIPLRLTVWDFSLPDVAHMRNTFGLNVYNLREYDRRDSTHVAQQYVRDMADHHVYWACLGFPRIRHFLKPDGHVGIDTREYDAMASYCLETLHNPLVSLTWSPIHQGQTGEYRFLEQPLFSGKFEQYVTEYIRLVADHARRKGWLDRMFVFLWDEPHVAPEVYPDVARLCRLFKQAAPELKIYISGHFEGKLRDVSEIDIISSHIRAVDPDREIFPALAHGKEVWSTNGTPFSYIDHVAIGARLLPWIDWKYGITGIDYYFLNTWRNNPWLTPVSWGRRNGNGNWIYPSPDGPVSSIRYELLREGIEDYEYFYMLRALIREREASGGAVPAAARQALESIEQVSRIVDRKVIVWEGNIKKIVESFPMWSEEERAAAYAKLVFTHNPDFVVNVRRKVAEQIIALTRGQQ